MKLLETEWRPVPDFYARELAGVSRAYFRAAVFWLVLGVLVGLSYSFQFVEDWGAALIPPSPEHSLGRVRMAHSALMLHGVLANAFLGALHAAASRPEKRARRQPGAQRAMAWLGFVLWQASLLAGTLAMVYGKADAIPLFEMPAWADAGLAAGWLLALGALIGSVRVTEDEPESGYAGGVLPWMTLALVGGLVVILGAALLPFLKMPRHAAAVWIAAFQGGIVQGMLWPLGFGATLGFLRFRLPHVLWNRWWQGVPAVAMAAVAPLAGLSALAVEGPPRGLIEVEYLATAVYVGLIALLMVSFAIALRAAMGEELEPPPWRSRGVIWFAAGWVAMGVYAMQELLMTLTPELREALRFTDWTAGRQHLLLLLGLGAWAFGCLDELWPELRRSEGWRMPLLADLHLILTLAGGWTMAGMLFTAGWVQSGLTEAMAPWSEVIEGTGAMWTARMAAGMAILLAQVLLLVNFVATRDRTLPELRRPRESAGPEPELLDPDAEGLLR